MDVSCSSAPSAAVPAAVPPATARAASPPRPDAPADGLYDSGLWSAGEETPSSEVEGVGRETGRPRKRRRQGPPRPPDVEVISVEDFQEPPAATQPSCTITASQPDPNDDHDHVQRLERALRSEQARAALLQQELDKVKKAAVDDVAVLRVAWVEAETSFRQQQESRRQQVVTAERQASAATQQLELARDQLRRRDADLAGAMAALERQAAGAAAGQRREVEAAEAARRAGVTAEEAAGRLRQVQAQLREAEKGAIAAVQEQAKVVALERQALAAAAAAAQQLELTRDRLRLRDEDLAETKAALERQAAGAAVGQRREVEAAEAARRAGVAAEEATGRLRQVQAQLGEAEKRAIAAVQEGRAAEQAKIRAEVEGKQLRQQLRQGAADLQAARSDLLKANKQKSRDALKIAELERDLDASSPKVTSTADAATTIDAAEGCGGQGERWPEALLLMQRDFNEERLRWRRGSEGLERQLKELKDSTDAGRAALEAQLMEKEHQLSELKDSTEAGRAALEAQLMEKEHQLSQVLARWDEEFIAKTELQTKLEQAADDAAQRRLRRELECCRTQNGRLAQAKKLAEEETVRHKVALEQATTSNAAQVLQLQREKAQLETAAAHATQRLRDALLKATNTEHALCTKWKAAEQAAAKQLAEAEGQLTQLKAAQQTAAEEAEAQAQRRAEAEAELGELRRRCADVAGQLQAAQRTATELAQGRAQQRAEEERRAADAEARCVQLEAELEEARRAAASQSEGHAQQQAEEERRGAAARRQIAELEVQLERTTAEVARAQAEAQAKVGELQCRSADLEEQLQAAQQTTAEAARQQAEGQARLAELGQRCTDLEGQLQEARRAAASQAEGHAQQQTEEEIRGAAACCQIAALEVQLEAAERTSAEQGRLVEELRQQCTSLETTLEASEKAAAVQTQEWARQRAEDARRVEELDQKCAQLKAQLKGRVPPPPPRPTPQPALSPVTESRLPAMPAAAEPQGTEIKEEDAGAEDEAPPPLSSADGAGTARPARRAVRGRPRGTVEGRDVAGLAEPSSPESRPVPEVKEEDDGELEDEDSAPPRRRTRSAVASSGAGGPAFLDERHHFLTALVLVPEHQPRLKTVYGHFFSKELVEAVMVKQSALANGPGWDFTDAVSLGLWEELEGVKTLVSATTLRLHRLRTRRFAEIAVFATERMCKRRGMGRVLMEVVKKYARMEGCEFILVRAHNDDTVKSFWTSSTIGFRVFDPSVHGDQELKGRCRQRCLQLDDTVALRLDLPEAAAEAAADFHVGRLKCLASLDVDLAASSGHYHHFCANCGETQVQERVRR